MYGHAGTEWATAECSPVLHAPYCRRQGDTVPGYGDGDGPGPGGGTAGDVGGGIGEGGGTGDEGGAGDTANQMIRQYASNAEAMT